MRRIIAISAGHYSTKKSGNIIRERIRYLNYGLLGLATILKHQGNLDIVVYQADSYSVEELFELIEDSDTAIATDCSCFLLSIPSYYSMSWCIEFCEKVKRRYQKPIVVGGRWVVDNHTDWIRDKLKHVDAIIEGFGERKLAEYFHIPNWETTPDGREKCFDWIDYTLLYDYKKYQPCIEISRGCGAGCQFCADKTNKRLSNKSVSLIKAELDFLDQIYDSYSVYFEAPHFVFEKKWVNELCTMLNNRKRPIRWRCTSRVETVPISLLEQMGSAGLRILDIGLESASPQQLLAMKKTLNPQKYLEKADELLRACAKNNIWVKFNLLLYAGESYETIDETIQWLLQRKDIIKDVSVSSLVYYYNMDSLTELQKLGASIPNGEDVLNTGYIDLNLSDSINKDTAKRISVDIPKLIANQRDFYDVKAISYFEPGYTYDEFIKDVSICDYSSLPFSIEY